MSRPATHPPLRLLRATPDIVVIGGSAGGMTATMTILADLPTDFPASVFVALHRRRDPQESGGLTSILAGSTALPVISACDEAPVEHGRVYVAPHDVHLSLEKGIMRVQDSPPENSFRPSINVLLKSAAAAYGRRVIGVLLSGIFGNDGAAGLWQIREHGGVTIVQDPLQAEHPGMPRAALEDVDVDYVLPATRIGALLTELVEPVADRRVLPRILIVEDESVVATNLQHSLTEMGYDVIDWVPTGEAALEAIEQEHPNLVLMDIHLAGELTGIDTARRIWRQFQVPVVYCTAHADLATLQEAGATESYGYVVKPFQSPAVRAAIELALARRERELR